MDKKRGVFVVVVVVLFVFLVVLFYDFYRSRAFALGNEDGILGAYVYEVLQPAYIPEEFVVKHRLTAAGGEDGTDYTHGALWYVGGVRVYAFLHYTKELDALSDLGIMITVNQTKTTEEHWKKLDEGSALALLNRYLQQGDYAVGCGLLPDTDIVVCEAFVSDDNSFEQGAGVMEAQMGVSTTVFGCKHLKGGELFGAGSCIQVR